MKKYLFIILTLLSYTFTAQLKQIKLIDGSKISVVSNIDIGTKAVLQKQIHSEILADIDYCGKSPINKRNIQNLNIGKKNYNSILKNNTAYLIKQDTINFYIHSLNSEISCEPLKNAKLKILILQLLDKKSHKKYNLILLK